MTAGANPVEGTSPTQAALETLRAAGAHPIMRDFPQGGIIVFDHELRFLSAGGGGLAEVGLSQELLEGRTIFEVFPPAVVRLIEGPFRQALSGQESKTDVPFGDRTFLVRLAPSPAEDGSIVAGIGFAVEVTETRKAAAALRQSEESLLYERGRLTEAERVGQLGSWNWDVPTDAVTWSDGLFHLHGLDPAGFGSDFEAATRQIHPDDRETVNLATARSVVEREPLHVRYRIFRADDGELRWLESRGRAFYEGDTVVRFVGTVVDITEQKVAEDEAATATAFQEAIIAATPDFTFITDVTTGAMVYGSRDRNVLGLSPGEAQALGQKAIGSLVHPDDQPLLLATNKEARGLADGQVLQMRYRGRHTDGQWHWMSRRVVPFRRDAEGSVVEVLGVIRDITDVVQFEEQLAHSALHDGLTGLPNRSLMLDRLDTALARSARDGREASILFCDLDDFKDVNDTAGHSAGDAVLVEVAKRLRSTLRDGDTVARVGGDEFVIIIEPWNRSSDSGLVHGHRRGTVEDRALGTQVAGRIITALGQPINVDGRDHHVTVSIGISYTRAVHLGRTGASSADAVVKEADSAMYRAKRMGRNRMEVFDAHYDIDPSGLILDQHTTNH
jgi:diguanylate cyclase (GGDEF)-like protein/PAS domain S-box-containing protein